MDGDVPRSMATPQQLDRLPVGRGWGGGQGAHADRGAQGAWGGGGAVEVLRGTWHLGGNCCVRNDGNSSPNHSVVDLGYRSRA